MLHLICPCARVTATMIIEKCVFCWNSKATLKVKIFTQLLIKRRANSKDASPTRHSSREYKVQLCIMHASGMNYEEDDELQLLCHFIKQGWEGWKSRIGQFTDLIDSKPNSHQNDKKMQWTRVIHVQICQSGSKYKVNR